MISIRLLPLVGNFAENKDTARKLRLEKIIPALEKEQEVTLDFAGINSATQSFIHALISDLIRKYGPQVLDRVYFKNCDENVKQIINIVVEYMQEG